MNPVNYAAAIALVPTLLFLALCVVTAAAERFGGPRG
jgi:hypothetical protein